MINSYLNKYFKINFKNYILTNNSISESKEESKKEKIEDIKNIFIKDFITKQLQYNDVSFIDSIMNSDSISLGLEWDLKKHKSYDDKFVNFNISEINIYDLKRAISKDYLRVSNWRKILLWMINKDYDINNKAKLINNQINLLSTDDLYYYINSKNKLTEFLKNIDTWIRVKEKNEYFKIINILSEKEINNRLVKIEKKYSEEEKNKVKGILYDISLNRIVDTDIRLLFEYDFLTNHEKKVLVETFIPTINLQKAIDIWLLDLNEAKNKRKNILKFVLNWKWLSNDQINNIVENTSFSDVILESKDFFSSENNVKLIWEKVWFKNLENDFSELMDKNKEKIIESWPWNFKEFLYLLQNMNKNWRFRDLDKFKKWNIYKLSIRDKSWNISESYFKILSIDDNKKNFWLQLIWSWNQISTKSLNSTESIQNLTYLEFKTFLEKDTNATLDFYTQDDIIKRIKSGDWLKDYDYSKYTQEDLNENRDKIVSNYVTVLENEISDLKKEFELKKDNKKLENLIKQKENLLKSYTDTWWDNELLWLANLKKFINKLDEVDPDWKEIWFEKWTFLEKEWYVYEVIWIDTDNCNIQLKSLAWIEWANWELTYEIFYEIFKKDKVKRFIKIYDFQEMIKEKISWWDSKWNNHEIKDWKIIAKNQEYSEKKSDQEVEYLVSDKNNELVKINKISWNQVTVQLWERKNYDTMSDKEKKDEKIKKDQKWEKITLDSNKLVLNLNEIDSYIKKHELHPDWKVWKTLKQEEVKWEWNDFKWSIFTKIFNNVSFNELIAWWKIFVEWFKETMKRWNDVHAARFALALWNFLPEDMRQDLLIKVESAESSEMDKALEWLWKIDSEVAIDRIKRWLQNKDTPQYKKEAWLMFMVSKYWLLYAKSPLSGKKWSFLWYESFWGRIGDKLYLDYKKECEEWKIPFTEEILMYKLIWKQCKWAWFNWIKRRWKLYKEYEWKMKQWIEDENAKWLKEANAMRNFADRKNAAKNEFKWWEFNNWLWKYEWAIDRWGSMKDMHELPFMLLFSGTCYLLQNEQLNKFKSFTESWYWWLLFTRFLSQTDDMDLFNRTILKISKVFWEKDPEKFSDMYEKALKIYNNQNNNNLSIAKKMTEAENFWSEYWEALNRTLLKLNNQNNKYIKTDKVLLTNEEDFKDYNNKINSYVKSWVAVFSKEETMNDQFKDAWTSWLWASVFQSIWSLTTEWTFKNEWPARAIWEEIIWEIKNTINSSYVDDESINREIQIMNISRQLSMIFTYVKQRETQANVINPMKEWKWHWKQLKDLGVTSSDMDMISMYNLTELEDITSTEIKNSYRDIAQKILSKSIYLSEKFNNPLDEIKSYSKNKVKELSEN